MFCVAVCSMQDRRAFGNAAAAWQLLRGSQGPLQRSSQLLWHAWRGQADLLRSTLWYTQ